MNAPSTLLVVDDELGMVELVASYLTRDRFRVLRSYDGMSADEIPIKISGRSPKSCPSQQMRDALSLVDYHEDLLSEDQLSWRDDGQPGVVLMQSRSDVLQGCKSISVRSDHFQLVQRWESWKGRMRLSLAPVAGGANVVLEGSGSV